MTTKLKERIVEASRNNKINKGMKFFVLSVIALIVIMTLYNVFKVGIYILVLIGLASCLALNIMEVIAKEDKQIVKKNKLIYIILSNYNFVWYFIYTIDWLLLLKIIATAKVSLFAQVIIIITVFLATRRLSKIISNYYKEKLSR